MVNKFMKNNIATAAGTILSPLFYSHEVFGEKFYIVHMETSRLSDVVDVIPVMVSDRVTDIHSLSVGAYIEVEGQFRSFNKHEHKEKHLLLYLFARELRLTQGSGMMNPNSIFIDGYLCKPPLYRKTPKGREITDALLAVNRSYNRSDYIPCIFWGRNARYVSRMRVGDRIRAWGRIQSRDYQKKMDDDTIVKKVAFEISVNKFEHCEEIILSAPRVAET